MLLNVIKEFSASFEFESSYISNFQRFKTQGQGFSFN